MTPANPVTGFPPPVTFNCGGEVIYKCEVLPPHFCGGGGRATPFQRTRGRHALQPAPSHKARCDVSPPPLLSCLPVLTFSFAVETDACPIAELTDRTETSHQMHVHPHIRLPIPHPLPPPHTGLPDPHCCAEGYFRAGDLHLPALIHCCSLLAAFAKKNCCNCCPS